MSYHLLVFAPSAAPKEAAAFGLWFQAQTEWPEHHDYEDPAVATLSLKASPVLTWAALLFYGVWTNAPFSFVVFYAGLQTVDLSTIGVAVSWDEAAQVLSQKLGTTLSP